MSFEPMFRCCVLPRHPVATKFDSQGVAREFAVNERYAPYFRGCKFRADKKTRTPRIYPSWFTACIDRLNQISVNFLNACRAVGGGGDQKKVVLFNAFHGQSFGIWLLGESFNHKSTGLAAYFIRRFVFRFHSRNITFFCLNQSPLIAPKF